MKRIMQLIYLFAPSNLTDCVMQFSNVDIHLNLLMTTEVPVSCVIGMNLGILIRHGLTQQSLLLIPLSQQPSMMC